MATLYVNKSGNDSNDGLTPATAKLTIGGAVAEGISLDTFLDTIHVQSGVYHESVNGRYAHLIADGLVILDGKGVLETGVNQTRIFTLGLSPVVEGFVIQNFFGDGVFCDRAASAVNNPTVTNCRIRNCGIGVNFTTGSQPGAPAKVTFTVIHDCSTGISLVDTLGASNRTVEIQGCTIVDCDLGVNNGNWQQIRPTNNIIAFCDRLIDNFPSSNGWSFDSGDYNNFYFIKKDGATTADAEYGTTVATNLTDWAAAVSAAAGGTREANSHDSDPTFTNRANKRYRLKSGSAALNQGANIGPSLPAYQGPFGFPSVAISATENSTKWISGGILSGTADDGSGNVILTGSPTGTFETDVLDVGASVPGHAFDLEAVLDPSNLQTIDSDNTDTVPNRPTVEFRFSDTAFLKTDGTPSYEAVEIGKDMSAAAQKKGRYWQFKLTFRDDHTEA